MTLSTSAVAVCCCNEFGQVARASLYFVEQPRILDSDHRLVGKGGHQLDLLFGERLNNGSADDNDSYRTSIA